MPETPTSVVEHVMYMRQRGQRGVTFVYTERCFILIPRCRREVFFSQLTLHLSSSLLNAPPRRRDSSSFLAKHSRAPRDWTAQSNAATSQAVPKQLPSGSTTRRYPPAHFSTLRIAGLPELNRRSTPLSSRGCRPFAWDKGREKRGYAKISSPCGEIGEKYRTLQCTVRTPCLQVALFLALCCLSHGGQIVIYLSAADHLDPNNLPL